MNDCLERRIRLDCTVKSSCFGNVLHNYEVESVFVDFGVIVEYLLAFVGRSNSDDY